MTKGTKHILIYSALGLFTIFLLGYLFMVTRTSQTQIYADLTSGPLGVMPISGKPQFLQITPDLRFKLDTGADASSITEDDLNKLRKMGYKVEEVFYPAIGRDGRGDIVFSTKRYRVDLPFYTYSVIKENGHTVLDSLGVPVIDIEHPARPNVIHNVDFMPSKTGYSVLGIDFLEKFKIESHGRQRMLAFYFDMPKGYEETAKLTISKSPKFWHLLGHRYYIDLDVEGYTNSYFLDTGIQGAFLKRSKKECKEINMDDFILDTVASYRGRFPALRDDNAWIKIGNREGRRVVYYYDNDEESFAINPLNMFDYDLLIDFAGGKLMFKR